MTESEGVIKFSLQHEFAMLAEFDVSDLNVWRTRLAGLGLIGVDKNRYGGLGFGNLSVRSAAGFVITGSQTGLKNTLVLADYAEVFASDPELNLVCSRGETQPSSESMTHAILYAANPDVDAVFHVHSPRLWAQLDLPSTDSAIAYGTPEMGKAVQELNEIQRNAGLFRMGGHKDGIVSFGLTAQIAGNLILQALNKIA